MRLTWGSWRPWELQPRCASVILPELQMIEVPSKIAWKFFAGMYSRMKSTIAIRPVLSCSRRSPRVAGERARPGKATDRQDTVWQCSMQLNAQCLAALGAATANIHSASLPKCLRRQSRSPCPMARRSHVGPKLQRMSGRRRRRNGPTPMTPPRQCRPR